MPVVSWRSWSRSGSSLTGPWWGPGGEVRGPAGPNSGVTVLEVVAGPVPDPGHAGGVQGGGPELGEGVVAGGGDLGGDAVAGAPVVGEVGEVVGVGQGQGADGAGVGEVGGDGP